jgi:hypothetical protein
MAAEHEVPAITRRFLIGGLAVLLASGPLTAQDALGTISGRAVDEGRKPYTNFSVQLRDVATGQVAQTVPLTEQGLFAGTRLPLSARYLVELVDVRARRVICSEGPYLLQGPTAISRADVNIDCGVAPAALWLILAGAGTPTAIVITPAGPSR